LKMNARRHRGLELREQRVHERGLAGADLSRERDEALPRLERVVQHREPLAVRGREHEERRVRASSRRCAHEAVEVR
jgi:hypothetical protein